ncbi:DUF1572 family protein [Croceiramulus getboli]|nr:DUF1572 family protein [Flavobacteriaceae bacterium YJPT1-3]
MSYLPSIKKQFQYYKSLGERTFEQLSEEELFWSPGPHNNSIAAMVKHLSGNMKSRWTHFLTEDGEKEWRRRDEEFVVDFQHATDLRALWEDGWATLMQALDELTEEHLEQVIYIRNMGHTVTEAINRQLAHYAYHVGQIVYLGILLRGEAWQSLSIPRGASDSYNQTRFSKPKRRQHFTDDL